MSEAKTLTKEYRLRHWAALIHERISSGKKVDDWCSEHGISRNAYYYWLRKVKLAATLDVTDEIPPNVCELPKIVPLIPPQPPVVMNTPRTAITIHLNGLTLNVQEGASLEIIERTLEALKKIC